MRILCGMAVVLLAALAPVGSQAAVPGTVTKADKCPVCGMFVAKYPDFLAQVVFADNSAAFFDGAKDLFKYLFDFRKYNPAKDPADIAAIYVTDYYAMIPIDGRRAWYVVGSDVYGPMGRELIPFAREADAVEFAKDHGGKERLRFDQVTPGLIRSLD